MKVMVGELFQFSGFRAYYFLIAPGDMLVGFGPNGGGGLIGAAITQTGIELGAANGAQVEGG
jgi:hypothetical protein